jgi:hypothetical protein
MGGLWVRQVMWARRAGSIMDQEGLAAQPGISPWADPRR